MTQRTRWWWVRHAPVTGVDGRIYGNSDPDANTADPPTYTALARLLPKDALLVTSHLRRAIQTAAAIRDAGLDLPAPLIEPDLGEQCFGDWQGRKREEVWAELNPRHLFWLQPARGRPPGGETFVEMVQRVVLTIDRLNAEHAGRDIVVVAHGGTIRAALVHKLRLDPEVALACQVDNCSLTRLDHFGPTESHPEGAWAMFHFNQRPAEKLGVEPDRTAMLALLPR
ncbi:MAG: histidine phosphatase family protein [Alphaproteobacteria bacterium]|nr:histidine phosphatase family protein [Alphaproteobacteria bacterium]